MTWKDTLRNILSPHMKKEKIEDIFKDIDDSILQSTFQRNAKIPPLSGRGYPIPAGISSYWLKFLQFFPEQKKLLIYSLDEKGGIGPNTDIFPITEQDLEKLDAVDDWPVFSSNYFVRISEAPFMKDILKDIQEKQ